MLNVLVGKVVEVSNTTISVAINKEMETPYIVINGQPTRIGGVGSFLKIENDIFEIVNEKTSLDSDKREELVKIASNRIVLCRVVGYFEDNTFIQGNSGNNPNIFDNVYTVTDKELTKIYSGTSECQAINVGKYLYKQELDFYIDINKFFASHSLIVGNTGSGKSNTVNTIFSELFANINTTNSLFLFIDTNGEYSKAFTNEKNIKKLNTRKPEENTIRIPIELLEKEDWKLLLEATEKTQYPIIKTVWNGIKKNVFEKGEKANIAEFIIKELKKTLIVILKSNSNATNKMGAIGTIRDGYNYSKDEFYSKTYDIFNVFDNVCVNSARLVFDDNVFTDVTDEIVKQIEAYSAIQTKNELNIEDFGFLLNLAHLYKTYRYNINENNTSPLISRFIANKKDFGIIFQPFNMSGREDLLQCLFGEQQVVVCDVSRANKDIRRIIVTFLCSKLYNYAVDKERNNGSLHLIVDEAHNYLSAQKIDKEDAIAKTCIETFEGIIKEGRKFGVFLTMATQRPSDITSTLLSQSHNYVIHKLVNPRDIDIIKNTVPFIDETSITMLSILAPGQAIFSGTAFNRPNIVQVKFDDETTRVESSTIKLMDTWERKDKGIN